MVQDFTKDCISCDGSHTSNTLTSHDTVRLRTWLFHYKQQTLNPTQQVGRKEVYHENIVCKQQ